MGVRAAGTVRTLPHLTHADDTSCTKCCTGRISIGRTSTGSTSTGRTSTGRTKLAEPALVGPALVAPAFSGKALTGPAMVLVSFLRGRSGMHWQHQHSPSHSWARWWPCANSPSHSWARWWPCWRQGLRSADCVYRRCYRGGRWVRSRYPRVPDRRIWWKTSWFLLGYRPGRTGRSLPCRYRQGTPADQKRSDLIKRRDIKVIEH